MAKTSFKLLALIGGLAVGAVTPAFAQDSGPLIDALVKKGILTDQEGEELRVDLQKDFAESSAGKLSLSSNLKELKLSGDARVRYEYRSGENNTPDSQERDRFRYRFRLGLTGKFSEGWFFGTRLESASGNRSTNVTLGDSGASGPFNKSSGGIFIGQVYIGRTVSGGFGDLTVTGGRFANPLTTTSMVWDGDINIDGLAEQWSYSTDKVTYMANLMQAVYDDGNSENPIGGGTQNNEVYLLAAQAGAKIKLGGNYTLSVMPTIYEYGNARGDNAGALTTANATPVGLRVIEIPIELGFKLGGLPAKFWLDYAVNLDADERADFFGNSAGGEDTAYQIGFALGQTKAKGDWEAKVFYQSVEALALDANLVDSDLFDSRTNMEGFVLQGSYVFANGVTGTLTYAKADRKNDSFGTFGTGDIGAANLTNYSLIQADISVKF